MDEWTQEWARTIRRASGTRGHRVTAGSDRRVVPRHGTQPNPWEHVPALVGMAAMAGAGVGAGSALMFAERRAGAQDRELESLAHRVTKLERK